MQTFQEYLDTLESSEFKKFVDGVHFVVFTEISNRFTPYETLPIEIVRRETRELVNQFDVGFALKAMIVDDILKDVSTAHGNRFC